MTYISRKTRLLVPRWFDECDPAYLYHLNRKRSDGRLKRHGSCDDLRAWVDDQYLNYQYLLELVTDGEFPGRPFLGIMGRIIPVENILDVLCGNSLRDSGEYNETMGTEVAMLGPEPGYVYGSDEKSNAVTTDDILKITNAAMSKLENISNLVHTVDSETNRSCDEKNDLNLPLSGDIKKSTEVLSRNDVNREDYLTEYDNIVRKISCLRQRLGTINQRRKELEARIQSSRQAICRLSSGMTVTELYSREEQMQAKRLQKKIEKLIKEKGHVLNEMCEAIKYLDELKKKLDSGLELSSHKEVFHPEKGYCKKLSKCPCTNDNNNKKSDKERDGSVMSSRRRKKRDIENSESLIDLRSGHSPDNSTGECPQRDLKDSETICLDDTKKDVGSSEAVFTPGTPVSESQKKQLVSQTMGGGTVNDLEQILRGYEQRLRDLENVEVQIEELKKKASAASYYKKRWLRCTTRDGVQKIAERARMKEELKQLYVENSELKRFIVNLTAKSEKEQNEIQYLKCKHKQLSEMEEEMIELKKDLKEYQISFETQRECIDSLENTVTVQREKIENLMIHIRRLSGVAEKGKEKGKISKKCPSRSRSHGSESKRNFKRAMVASSEESVQNSLSCYCCSCAQYSEALNRPRSECTRRLTLVPHAWRRQSCNN